MSDSKPLKILVVDDTIVYRKIVSDVLADVPGVEVVGTASNGKIALSKIDSHKPDLITLDIEMPEMNGLEVLENLRSKDFGVGAIVLSTLTQEGGEMTIKALELGAFDFIPKPQSGTMAENYKVVKDLLVPMLRAFRRRQEIKNILKGPQPSRPQQDPVVQGEIAGRKKDITDDVIRRMEHLTGRIKNKAEIVAIGVSTGGPSALSQMMPMIPENIGVPILIVQHMPPIFTQSLANSLNAKSAIEIREARDGETLQPNLALIAPGGRHMKIVASPDGMNRIVRITDDPPENSCRPSVDYLFRSIAVHFVGRATGVIMTGMGSDGTEGLKLLKRNGSHIIAQDEASCTVFGMPKEAIEAGIADVITPLDHIAQKIVNSVKGYY